MMRMCRVSVVFVALLTFSSGSFADGGGMTIGNLADLIARDILVGIENASVDATKVVSPRWRKVKLAEDASRAYLNKPNGFYWALKESALPLDDDGKTRDWRFYFRAIVHYQEDGIGRVGMMDRRVGDRVPGIRVRVPDFQNKRPDMLARKIINPASISGIAILPTEAPPTEVLFEPTDYVLAGQGHEVIETPRAWRVFFIHGRVKTIFSDGYALLELTGTSETSYGEATALAGDEVFYALLPLEDTWPKYE